MPNIEIVDIDGVGNPAADGCSATYTVFGDPNQGNQSHSGLGWSESTIWYYTYYQLNATVGGQWEFDHWEWDFITKETYNGEDVHHDPDPHKNYSITHPTSTRRRDSSLREGNYDYNYTNEESPENNESRSITYSVKNLKAVFRLPKVRCTIHAYSQTRGCEVYPEEQVIEVPKKTDFTFTVESIPAKDYKLEKWTEAFSGVEVSKEPTLELTLNSGEYGVQPVYYAYFKKDEGGTGIILRTDTSVGTILRDMTSGVILRDKDPLVK